MLQKTKAIVPILFGLYVVSIFTTMAGMEIFSGLLAFCGLLITPQFIKNHPLDKPVVFVWSLLLLLFAAGAVSAFLNFTDAEAFFDVIGRMRWALLLILISISLSFVTDAFLFKLFKFVVPLAVFISLYAFIQHFTGIDLVRDSNRAVIPYENSPPSFTIYRSSGFLSAPLTFGYSFGLYVSILLGYILCVGKLSQRALIFAFFVGSLALYSTLSRGVWLAFALSSLFGFWFLLPYKNASKVTFLFSLPVLAVLFFSDTIFFRFIDMFNPQSISSRDRFNLWSANITMFKEHPFFGVGYGQNEALSKVYLEKVGIITKFFGHAHNNFLQFLSGTGLVGTLLYLAISIFFIFENLRLIKAYKQDLPLLGLFSGTLLAQLYLHLGGLTECNFKDGEVNHFVITIYGIILSRRFINKK